MNKSKSEGFFLSLPFVTLFSHPSPARSLTPFSFPLLNSGKPKLPEIVSACKFLLKNPIFAFCIELKKQLQFFQSVYWERVPKRVRRFRFLRFGFAYGSSGSRFLRFVNYLIFYGSVPRFRFGSRTFLHYPYCLHTLRRCGPDKTSTSRLHHLHHLFRCRHVGDRLLLGCVGSS